MSTGTDSSASEFELQSLLDAVDEFVRKRVEPRAAEIDRENVFARDIFEAMAGMDLLAAWVPTAYGGVGLGLKAGIPIAERIARASATCAFMFCATNDSVVPILRFGSEEQKHKYLPPLASGQAIGALAISEIGAGSDVTSMRTRAVRGDGGFTLNGRKMWITNGSVADVTVVVAVTDPDAGPHGLSAFVVPRGTPGLSTGRDEELLGLRGSPTSELVFDDAWLPEDALLGEEGQGFRIALSTLDEDRLMVSAVALGIGRGALELAIEYAREREQFGEPVINNQGLQFLLAENTTELAAGYALLSDSVAGYLEGPSKEVGARISMAKLYCSEVAMRAAVDAVQVFGAAGLSSGNPVERMLRDAKGFQIFDGTSQIQKLILGRHLQKERIPLPRWMSV
jgi:acyl-CoA dehydrogenase